MLYEVISMSDCVTFEASDDAIAGVVGLLLGHGRYAVKDTGDRMVLPLMIFGGGVAEWLTEHRIPNGDGGLWTWALAPERRAEIMAAFRSCAVISLDDRGALMVATDNDPGALARWNEKKRTSMNDICGRAMQIADVIEHDEGVAPDPPQQIFVL